MSWLRRAPKATITKMTKAELIADFEAQKARLEAEGGPRAEHCLSYVTRTLEALRSGE